jgi:hypothetical protein
MAVSVRQFIGGILDSRGYTGSQGYGSINFLTRNYTGNSTSTTFAITTGLDADSVFVFENGIMQFPTTDYSITGTNLTFTTAPATDVAIQIRELIIDSGGLGYTGSQGTVGYTGSGSSNARSAGYSLIFGG